MSPGPWLRAYGPGAHATFGCGYAALGSVQFLLIVFRVARPRASAMGVVKVGNRHAHRRGSGTCHRMHNINIRGG